MKIQKIANINPYYTKAHKAKNKTKVQNKSAENFCYPKNYYLSFLSSSNNSRFRDISILGGKTRTVTYEHNEDGWCFLKGFLVDDVSDIPNYVLGAIDECYDKYQFILRDLQYNNGTASDLLIEHLRKDEDYTGESYVAKKVQEALLNLEEQKEEIKTLKPLERDCVLWRGIINPNWFKDEKDDIFRRPSFSRHLLSLEKGEESVLDWCTMSASPYFETARQYGPNHLMRIKLPKGAKIIRHNREEARIPSMAKYRFIDKNTYDSYTIWDFEFLKSDYT